MENGQLKTRELFDAHHFPTGPFARYINQETEGQRVMWLVRVTQGGGGVKTAVQAVCLLLSNVPFPPASSLPPTHRCLWGLILCPACWLP